MDRSFPSNCPVSARHQPTTTNPRLRSSFSPPLLPPSLSPYHFACLLSCLIYLPLSCPPSSQIPLLAIPRDAFLVRHSIYLPPPMAPPASSTLPLGARLKALATTLQYVPSLCVVLFLRC